MAYIGVSPQNGVRKKHTYTASGSQTSFTGAGAEGITLSYKDSNFVDVYQNGVKLAEADYTSTSGTTIVLAQGAAANDIVEIIVFDVFSTSDMVSASDGGTFAGNVAMSGTLTLTGNGDFNGDLDVDGTLETDALTINGVTLAETISDTVGAMVTSNTETGITVTYDDSDNTLDFVVGTLNQDTTGTAANATLAATVTVTDSTANTNFPIVFHDESNALLDDTGALRYNPSTGELLVPKLTVAGTTTTVDTVTMNAANAVVFEGATADAHETTLTIVDPTADRTINLPNVSGTIPVLAAASNTAITSTPAELNLLDGITAGTVSASLAVIVDSNKDITGFRNVTLTGELDAGSLDISGDIDVDGTTNLDVVDIDGAVDMASTLTVGGALSAKGGAVFNEDSADVDFRIESNASANMFFVDGGNDHVCINTSTDAGGVLNIKTTGNTANLVLFSTDADANAGPLLDLMRDSSSPADNDAMGSIRFRGDDDAGNETQYVDVTAYASDVSDGGEDGQLQFRSVMEGTLRNRFDITPTEVVFNEDSVNSDFRVESNGNANMLFVDGGNDKVGIGTLTPARQLTVENTIANSGGELGITTSDSSTTGTFGTIHFGNNTDTSLASIRAKADGSTSAGKLEFNTEADGGAIETRMTIDANGNVGVATGASLTAAQFNVELAGVAITGDTDGATMEDSGIFQLYNSNNGTTNSTVMLLGGTSLGVPAQIASGIGFTRENSSNWGTQLRFYTHETATSDVDALRERIRIDSAGNTMFGCTAFGEDGLSVGIRYSNSNTTTQLRWNRADDSGAGGALVFMNAGTQVGTVTYTSSSTSYTTSSDYRLKENVDHTTLTQQQD
jgi:cytoskeletal protein CcmA (bactofilin family)